MPCKISIYKKQDGKVYIGTMNAGLMGKMFGPLVGEVMGKVAQDQKLFLEFDPSKPAPEIILPKAPTVVRWCRGWRLLILPGNARFSTQRIHPCC